MRKLALTACLAVAVSVLPQPASAARPRILFTAETARFKPMGIFKMDPNGSDLKRIYRKRASSPAWSPDRKWISFVVSRCPSRDDCDAFIYVMRPNGSDVRRFAGNADTISGYDWSPDSESIVYSAFDQESTDYDLYIATKGQRTTLTDTADAYELFPDWSPDGSTIVFERSGDAEDIYAISPDGSNERNLTNDEHLEGFPRWSPDGTRIAFASSRDDQTQGEDAPYTDQLFVMDPDGGSVVRISTNEDTLKRGPHWSRDGSRIAWTEECDHDYCAYDTEIWVSDGDGENPRNVTHNAKLNEQAPQWSPDGLLIVFYRYRGNSSSTDLFSMKPSGERVRRLTDTKGPEDAPSWQYW